MATKLNKRNNKWTEEMMSGAYRIMVDGAVIIKKLGLRGVNDTSWEYLMECLIRKIGTTQTFHDAISYRQDYFEQYDWRLERDVKEAIGKYIRGEDFPTHFREYDSYYGINKRGYILYRYILWDFDLQIPLLAEAAIEELLSR